MLLMGDEVRRTQLGNNNAYCQNNEMSWFDWKLAESSEGRALIAYVARLVELRHQHSVLRCRHFLHGKDEPAPGVLDIQWFDTQGNVISDSAWNNGEERVLALRRASRSDDASVPMLSLYLNPTANEVRFRMPPPKLPTRILIDSSEPDAPEHDLAGDEIAVAARSAALTISVHKADVS